MLQMVIPLSASMKLTQSLCIAITMGLIECISKKIYDVKTRNSTIAQSWDTNSSSSKIMDCTPFSNLTQPISILAGSATDGQSIKCIDDDDQDRIYRYYQGKYTQYQ